MLVIPFVFVLSAVQNFIATTEVYNIAQGYAKKAALWAAVSSTVYFLLLVLVVVDYSRWRLIVPYVLGDMCGTYLALCRKEQA